MSVCIQYNSEKWNDGCGAQVQRIAAIYSIAKEFKLNFVHSRIRWFESNPGDGFSNKEQMDRFIVSLNKFLKLENHICLHTHKRRNFTYRRVFRFRLTTRVFFFIQKVYFRVTRQNVLYSIDNPYLLIENYPDIYKHFSNEFAKSLTDKILVEQNRKFSVHLHIRTDKEGNKLMKARHVELQFYVDLLQKLEQINRHFGINAKVVVHTDAPIEETKWYPIQITEETAKFWRESGVMSDSGYIELNPINFSGILPFVEDLEILRLADPLTSWSRMSAADVLVMNKSSFSFVGALLNSNGFKIGPSFRHKFPREWNVWEATSENRTVLRDYSRYLQLRLRSAKSE